ncbi:MULTISPECIES: zf-HC2 domain-containing protein [unclassified Paenibacillus]|uniref:zf-HC2 domain-containing protein n=1 Tax=unclassified Paenibacillus TaxID=185978 RepID=UPI0009566FD3|nr:MULTISPECIES: zf-HC2 domain-containing protein [unclassified Paenibacillus]ASS66065.1 zf-HC2 domain-containing protein [Paenibacillus sp. RUD330]SIQ13641.1 Putative zinc-finger [Paenibacillus sp. RU4X]SIQ35460.1 Putative zinc-finger [Paenibacillus sp. RU4T]
MSEGRHHNQEAWAAYARNTLPDRQREEMELHLSYCDGCLELLVQALDIPGSPAEDKSGAAPGTGFSGIDSMAVPVPAAAMERIRCHVLELMEGDLPDVKRASKSRTAWLRRPALHYGLAASLTLLLYMSGAFTDMDRFLESREPQQGASAAIPNPASGTSSESWSNRMLDRTAHLLQEIQDRRYR